MPALVDPRIAEALQGGSSQSRHFCDVFHDGVPVMKRVAMVPTGSLSRSSTSRVNSSGRMYIASDVMALDGSDNLIAPADSGDVFAPSGNEIVISREVSLGDQVLGSVSLGTFRITEVPDITRTARRLSRNSVAITGVLLEVAFSDRLEAIQADEFTSVTSPKKGNSSWDEIRRLSPFPIVRSLPDASVPSTLVYGDSRIEAMNMLADNMGGYLAVTREGAITAVDGDPLASTSTPQHVLEGSIQEVQSGMVNDYYNVVAVYSSTGSNNQILAVVSLDDGPRAARSGNRRVLRVAGGKANTAGTAAKLAQRTLDRVSSKRTVTVVVTCLPNLAVELGDIVKATDPRTGRTSLGAVSAVDYDLDPTQLMKITLDTKAGVEA